MKKIKREIVKVKKEEGYDLADNVSCTINDNVYNFVETFLSPADGEGHTVIFKRKSDEDEKEKFFEFSWFLSFSENYFYGSQLREVFPKKIEKYIYE